MKKPRRERAGQVEKIGSDNSNSSRSVLHTSPSLQPTQQPTDAGELFARYCAAATAAQQSHDLTAGIEAGRAWRRFLEAFCREAATAEAA